MPRCSFCSEPASATRPLVSGEGVSICGACARLALEVAESAAPPPPDLVLRDVGTLVTMDRRQGRGMLGMRHDVAVAVKRSRIVWIGDTEDIPDPYRELERFDCDGRLVLPGFVDAMMRPLGGPHRDRPDPDLLAEVGRGTLRRTVSRGVSAVGLYVGGGEDPTTETLELAVARIVGEESPAAVSVAWRCSPDLPPDLVGRVLAPTASRLASSAVIECHGEGPDVIGGRLQAIRPMRPRLVCDEPMPDACRPHWPNLLSIQVRGLPARLGTAGVAGTGASPVAVPPIAVSWTVPGLAVSAWALGQKPALVSGSHPRDRVLAGMGVVLMAAVDLAGLGIEEALFSVTRAGASVLGDDERGRLTLGAPADVIVADAETVEDLFVRPDHDPTWAVLIGGRLLRT